MPDLRTQLRTPRSMTLRAPSWLLFGNGMLAELAPLLGDLGVHRPLLVTDPGVAATGLPERIRKEQAAAGIEATVWDGLEPDPDEDAVERCRREIEAGGHDGVVAVGGGSVMDAAKVAAPLSTNGGRVADYFGFDTLKRPGLPLVMVPTTAGSGAEVSAHAVIVQREPRRKHVVGGLHVVPHAAVIDPLATLTLPPAETTYSALDGLVHAVEAHAARRGNAVTSAYARLAAPAIAAALPRVLADGKDPDAREELSSGCLYASLAMANANAGAIHALGYPLTGQYGIPHGLANALMAPGTLERVHASSPRHYGEMARLLDPEARELDDAEAAARLPEIVRRLLTEIGVTDTLESWGVAEEDLPDLAEKATVFQPVLQNTPLVLEGEDLLAVYRSAWAAGR